MQHIPLQLFQTVREKLLLSEHAQSRSSLLAHAPRSKTLSKQITEDEIMKNMVSNRQIHF